MTHTGREKSIEQLQAENQRLRRALEELSILNEIATAISSTLSIKEIVQLMVQKCIKHLGVEQAAVMLLDRGSSANPFQTMVRQADTQSTVLPFRLDTQLTGWMLKNQQPLLITDLATDERFSRFSNPKLPIRSLLTVPLVSKGKMIGVITVFNKKNGTLGVDDQRLLTIIATQSSQIIENARLLEEEQQLLVIREEMRMARDIQTELLPKAPPVVPGYDISGKSIPAKVVGGDYFDFMVLDDHRLMFCLGDVTGKGLSAAILMGNTQATIRGQALLTASPKECMHTANLLMFKSTGLGKFVTLFYGILDYKNHMLTYSNAGHDEPYLLNSEASISRLKTGGVVLGFVPEYQYQEANISIQPGDRLVVYSDGIPEAMNAREEEFSDQRLEQIITENPHLSSAALIDKIITAVQAHAGDTPQSDDITLVVVTRQH